MALLRGESVRDVGALSAGGRSALQVALLADAPMALPLCEETAALMRAAASPWSNHTHRVWPESFRARGVLTVLCVAKFGEGWAALPQDLLLHALSFCGRAWFLSPHADDAAADGEAAADAGAEEESPVGTLVGLGVALGVSGVIRAARRQQSQ